MSAVPASSPAALAAAPTEERIRFVCAGAQLFGLVLLLLPALLDITFASVPTHATALAGGLVFIIATATAGHLQPRSNAGLALCGSALACGLFAAVSAVGVPFSEEADVAVRVFVGASGVLAGLAILARLIRSAFGRSRSSAPEVVSYLPFVGLLYNVGFADWAQRFTGRLHDRARALPREL